MIPTSEIEKVIAELELNKCNYVRDDYEKGLNAGLKIAVRHLKELLPK